VANLVEVAAIPIRSQAGARCTDLVCRAEKIIVAGSLVRLMVLQAVPPSVAGVGIRAERVRAVSTRRARRIAAVVVCFIAVVAIGLRMTGVAGSLARSRSVADVRAVAVQSVVAGCARRIAAVVVCFIAVVALGLRITGVAGGYAAAGTVAPL
jgi:hypothetical protein